MKVYVKGMENGKTFWVLVPGNTRKHCGKLVIRFQVTLCCNHFLLEICVPVKF